LCKEWPSRSESIASISSSLSVSKKCFSLTLSSWILYWYYSILEALNPHGAGDMSRKSENLDWIMILYHKYIVQEKVYTSGEKV